MKIYWFLLGLWLAWLVVGLAYASHGGQCCIVIDGLIICNPC